jgi:hypothetical protein
MATYNPLSHNAPEKQSYITPSTFTRKYQIITSQPKPQMNTKTAPKHTKSNGSKSNNKMGSHATGIVDPVTQSPPTLGPDKDHDNHANNHTVYQMITPTIAAHIRNIRNRDAHATTLRNFVLFLPTASQEMRTSACLGSPKQQTQGQFAITILSCFRCHLTCEVMDAEDCVLFDEK